MKKTLVLLMVLAFGLMVVSAPVLADPPRHWGMDTPDSGGDIEPPPPDDGGWIDPTTNGVEDPTGDNGVTDPDQVAEAGMGVDDWLFVLQTVLN